MVKSVLDVISEKDFQKIVVREAESQGWWVYHNPDSRMSSAGLPDLILLREPDFFMAELKSARGRLSEIQQIFIEKLINSGIEVHVWRPADLDAIKERLKGKSCSNLSEGA